MAKAKSDLTNGQSRSPADHQGQTERQRLVAGANGRKLADIVAEAVEADIVAAGWPIGEVLGSEAQLLERFGVSRAVFREAMRIVEDHRVAYMRRGPNGGLVVTAPDTRSLSRSAALLLDYQEVTGSHLAVARITVEVAVVGLVAARIDEDGVAQLKAAIDHEAALLLEAKGPLEDLTTGEVFHGTHDLHAIIARLAANPPLQLFVEVLIELTSSAHGSRTFDTVRTDAERRKTATALHRAHRALVDAIVSGDVSLAQHRMRRHLEAMEPWLS